MRRHFFQRCFVMALAIGTFTAHAQGLSAEELERAFQSANQEIPETPVRKNKTKSTERKTKPKARHSRVQKKTRVNTAQSNRDNPKPSNKKDVARKSRRKTPATQKPVAKGEAQSKNQVGSR